MEARFSADSDGAFLQIGGLRRLMLVAVGFAVAFMASPASAVSIDWVTVGGPGNAPDPSTGYGAVGYTYQISKYEVTNAQYAEFLNAVAATDPYALYDTSMSFGYGGITQSGSDGSYTYSAIAGRENMPVNYVTFWDAARFTNWLQNGQPVGPEGAGTTETGAYTLTAAGISANSITRNAGATIFLPSENEWYKAAYFDVTSGSYYRYPAGTSTPTVCAFPGPTANTANCNGSVGNLTPVGSYTGSPSPNGTFDQGGNVFEWNEMILGGTDRGISGGSWFGGEIGLEATPPINVIPISETSYLGFRVATLPEPDIDALLLTGLLGLALADRGRRSAWRLGIHPMT